MPAALRAAGGLGVGAIFALRFCKAFREKLHPAPFLFDRAGSKVKPIAGREFRCRGSASNLQLSASCHGLSSVSSPCASAATGLRAAVRPEAGSGPGPGRIPREGAKFSFSGCFEQEQIILSAPVFSHPMRQAAGLRTGSRLPVGAPLPPSAFPQCSPT